MTTILKLVKVEAPWLSEWLRDARKAAGLTQTELAVKSGVSRGFICSVEAGKAVAVKEETLQRLAATLEVRLDAGTSQN